MATAESVCSFDYFAETKDRRLVEPLRHQLDIDRKLLRTEAKRYRESRQTGQVERHRGTHHVRRRHFFAVDDVSFEARRGGGEWDDWAQQNVVLLKISGEGSLKLVDLHFCVHVFPQRGVWPRCIGLSDEMQLGFTVPDSSSDVASQLSAVQNDSGIQVVVLLKERNAHGLYIAPCILQQICRGRYGSRNLSVDRSKAW